MALTLSGRLYDPFGNVLEDAGIRFRAARTSTQVLANYQAEATTDSSGDYTITVQYGVYHIEARQSDSTPWYTIARSIPVTTDSTSNDINALIVAYLGAGDATPEIVLEIEAIAASATVAAASASASAQEASDAVSAVTSDASSLPVTESGGVSPKTLAEWTSLIPVKESSPITLRVPSDFTTLQSAVDFAGSLFLIGGGAVDVLIESGHEPVSGVDVRGGDYSRITISSEDPVVYLSSSFPSVSVIYGVSCRMPKLNCLIDAGGRGESGYYAESASIGEVSAGCGVTNAAHHGLYANSGSSVVCGGAIFTNASQESPSYSGILSWASKVDAFGADVSGSLYYGAQAAASGTIYFRSGIADNCARHACRATNAGVGVFRDVSAKNAGVSGVRSFDGSIAHCAGIDVSGCFTGIWCENKSIANAAGLTGDGVVGSLVYCNDMSEVNINNSTAAGIGGVAIRSEHGSRVSANGAVISTTGGILYSCARGSWISAYNSNASHLGTNFAISCKENSEVYAESATISTPNARLVSAFDSSRVNIRGATVSYLDGDAVNMSGGSFIWVNMTGIPQGDVAGVLFNTLYTRGICWGNVE